MSMAVARQAIASAFGWFFNQQRNVYDAFGYHKYLDYEQCLEKYRRQGVTSRLVNAYPNAIWARPPRILGNEQLQRALSLSGLDKKARAEADPGLNERLQLFQYINRAERLAGLGRFSILLLGFDDVRRASDLSRPVQAPANLIYLQAYGEGDLKINTLTKDPADPNFGRPELYQVTARINAGGAAFSETYHVHHSRVLHVTDEVLESDLFGYPICQRVFNDLDDLLKTSGGAAEMMFLSARKGLQVNVDKDMQFTETDAENLRKEIDEYVHNLSRVIRTRGVDINNLGADNINPEPVYNIILSQISTTTGIPQRIFIGSEQAKLASEQDRANWAARVEDRIINTSEPRVLRPLIDKLQAAGAVPEGGYEVRWSDAFRLSPLEIAQTAAQQARSAVNVARAVREVPQLLSVDEARAIVLATGDVDAISDRDTDPEYFDVPEEEPAGGGQAVEDEDEEEEDNNTQNNTTEQQE